MFYSVCLCVNEKSRVWVPCVACARAICRAWVISNIQGACMPWMEIEDIWAARIFVPVMQCVVPCGCYVWGTHLIGLVIDNVICHGHRITLLSFFLCLSLNFVLKKWIGRKHTGSVEAASPARSEVLLSRGLGLGGLSSDLCAWRLSNWVRRSITACMTLASWSSCCTLTWPLEFFPCGVRGTASTSPCLADSCCFLGLGVSTLRRHCVCV